MCLADPGHLQGIGIDYPVHNIQNHHFSACGEQWQWSNPPLQSPNLMRFSQWCYGVTGVSRHELGHLPVAFFSGKVGGRGRLEAFPVHLFIWFNLERTLLVLGDAWTLGSCVDEKIDALCHRLIKYILLPFPTWGRTSLCGLCLNSAWPHCRLGWSWYWT